MKIILQATRAGNNVHDVTAYTAPQQQQPQPITYQQQPGVYGVQQNQPVAAPQK